MGDEAPLTILFTDVEGSTALRTRRGDVAAHEMLRAHEHVVRECLAGFGGKEVKALGDGSLICEDIEGTVAALPARGAEFGGPISDQGFGRTVMLKVPGAGDMMLYEPRHPLA